MARRTRRAAKASTATARKKAKPRQRKAAPGLYLSGKELVKAAVNKILVTPSCHDQESWCGTKKCVGGWIMTLGGTQGNLQDRIDDSDLNPAAEVARLTGMARSAADWLCDGERNLGEIVGFAREFCKGVKHPSYDEEEPQSPMYPLID